MSARVRELCSRTLAKGSWIPLDSRLFGGGGGDGRKRPSPCLADTPRRDDRPPTHFFVKKKFIPIGGAETTTQGVSSVFCYAHTLCGVRRCATLGFPHGHKVRPTHPRIPIGRSSSVCAETLVRRRKYLPRRRELFSLRKKRTAGIRLSAWQEAGSLYRLNPTPFSALKKPLK